MKSKEVIKEICSKTPKASKNGICSAHPLLVGELQSINTKLDEISEYVMEKKAIDNWLTKWKERCYGAIIMGGVLVAIEIIRFLTPL